MSALTVVYALLFYAATAILVLGVAWKCWVYARTPQPLKIPIPPAPTTRGGVALHRELAPLHGQLVTHPLRNQQHQAGRQFFQHVQRRLHRDDVAVGAEAADHRPCLHHATLVLRKSAELLEWLGIPPRHQTTRDSMLDTRRESDRCSEPLRQR